MPSGLAPEPNLYVEECQIYITAQTSIQISRLVYPTCIFTWMTSEHLKHKTEIIIISSKTCYSNSLPVSDVDNSSPQALKLKNWKQSFTCLFHPLHQFIATSINSVFRIYPAQILFTFSTSSTLVQVNIILCPNYYHFLSCHSASTLAMYNLLSTKQSEGSH